MSAKRVQGIRDGENFSFLAHLPLLMTIVYVMSVPGINMSSYSRQTQTIMPILNIGLNVSCFALGKFGELED